MPVEVTEKGSGQRMSLRPPWTAQREFEVSGVTTAEEALAAIDPRTGLAIPQRTVPYSPGSLLQCEGPEVAGVTEGGTFWTIRCQYTLNAITNGDEHPLNQPTKFRWETVETSEPVDRDLDGRPFMNAAGSLFQPASRPITYKRLYARRFEPAYDVAKAAAYENAVNEKAFTLRGLPIKAQHMRCCAILPNQEYDENSPYIEIVYVLEIVLDDALGDYPFQHVFLNAGTEGWWSDSGTTRAGKFTNGKGEEIGRPVRLAASGILHATESNTIKVGPNNASPAANPNAVSVYKYITDLTNGDRMVFKRVRLANLSALAL